MRKVLFHRRLTELREARRLTQEQLGEILGVTKRTVSRWETSASGTPMSRLPEIYEALGVSEEQFWDADWLPEGDESRRINTARRLTAGPYLEVPTNEKYMALECPRCGATDFSDKARYCRQCAFPLYNFCVHPDMDSRHINLPDAVYCEECARPTFWSKEYVTLEEILGERAMHSVHSVEEGQKST